MRTLQTSQEKEAFHRSSKTLLRKLDSEAYALDGYVYGFGYWPHLWFAKVLRQPLNLGWATPSGWAIFTAGPVVLRFWDMGWFVGAFGFHADGAILVVWGKSDDLPCTMLSVKGGPRIDMLPITWDRHGNPPTAVEASVIRVAAVKLTKQTSSLGLTLPVVLCSEMVLPRSFR